jgi:hypothetical protein
MHNVILIQKLICLLLFASLHNIASAQTPVKDNSVIISLSPMALADIFDGASVRLNGEIKIAPAYAAGLEGGFYLPYLKATKIEPHGFLIRPSIKKYLNGKTNSGKFIALEYMYKKQGFDFRDSIVIDTDRYEKQYTIKRQVHSIVFKYGKLINIGKRLVLEWYCGIGIRHIRSHSNLTAAEEDGILTGEAGDCPVQEDIIRLTGTRIFPDFRGGIKVGLSL